MSEKHTPGPWEIVCEGGGEPAAVYGQPQSIYASGLRVASMCGPGNDPVAWLANARLIAAAPDLLAACAAMLETYEDTIDLVWPGGEAEMAREAIAKARGEEMMDVRTIKLPCYGMLLNVAGKGAALFSDLKGEEFNGIESMILAHAIAGVDVESPAYISGIETAVEAVENHLVAEDE